MVLSKGVETHKLLSRALEKAFYHGLYLTQDLAVTVATPSKLEDTIKEINLPQSLIKLLPSADKFLRMARGGKVKYNVLQSEKKMALVNFKCCGGTLAQTVLGANAILSPILGDHEFSHCVGYIRDIPVLVPDTVQFFAKNKPQHIPFYVKQILGLEVPVTKNNLPLHVHRHQIKIPKCEVTGLKHGLVLKAPIPEYFLGTLRMLNILNEDLLQELENTM